MKTKSSPHQLAARAGAALKARRYPEAREALDRLLRTMKENPRLKLLSAGCDVARGEPALAVPVLLDLLAEYPAWPEPWESLGVAYRKLGEPALSARAFRRVLAFAPARVMPLVLLAGVRAEAGDVPEAHSLFAQAAAMPIDEAEHGERFNRALARLVLNFYVEGFADFEAREAAEIVRCDDSKAPTWDGRPTEGIVCLLQEQGFGDTLMMLRFVPAVAAKTGGVLLSVPRPLVALCEAQAWRGVQVVEQRANDYEGGDAHHFRLLPMSLPHVIGGSTGIARGPYLKAGGLDLLPPKSSPVRVAIAWKGNPEQGDDRTRSIPLAELLPLFRMPGIEWVSVQVGTTEAERALLLGHGVRDMGPLLTDFARTANVLNACDLVVTVCTSVVHLAGALGRPTYLLKSATPEWRWGLAGELSLWYASVRIRRQAVAHRWGPVIDALAGGGVHA